MRLREESGLSVCVRFRRRDANARAASRLNHASCPGLSSAFGNPQRGQLGNMDEIPSNEKSCQTEGLDENATVLMSEHLNQMTAYFIEPGDPPLLQRQLQTSKSGIQQIIECFYTGTTQLKHILLKEVDTIFECKLCRSLFRGLPNLITHKEFYCIPRLPEPEEPSGNCRQSIDFKKLLEVIYAQPKQEELVVHLEPIPGNQNAVFQHLAKQSDEDPNSPSPFSSHSMKDWKLNQPESQEQTIGEHNAVRESENEAETKRDGKLKKDKDAEAEGEKDDAGVEVVTNARLDDVIITCCLCGKDFGSRRSVRRHCREVHKQRLEELRKYTETRTVPISLLSVVKERQVQSSRPSGKCCPVCFKSFATKANVRRHFDEVHQGLRRDLIMLDTPTKSNDLEVMPAEPSAPLNPNASTISPPPHYNLATCKCLNCKRSYSTQSRLKRHMRLVHKIPASKSTVSRSSTGKKRKSEDGTDTEHLHKGLKRPREEDEDEKPAVIHKPKISVGFDFKQLFCKLCKRQFSSCQNLAKHIELHTDNGGDIFIKFYRCPLCLYQSRRKRDVLRHISVVHKKNSAYLAKILPGLESRAVKKPAETVLGSSVKHIHSKCPDDHHNEDTTSPYSLETDSSPSSVIPKQEFPPSSPPVTHRQSLSPQISSVVCSQTSNGLPNGEEAQDSTEVCVTKNFSLHTCDICGRAFAKKVYLESHIRSHRNAAKSDGQNVGVSTRSKTLLW
ncbi:zinc finger protein 800b isoform X1 [Silurus meridionalis]|nr:zinc finger protein 800b isoform X1 [Silurus meridionalis]XP_046729133.1 zinc finger protein 800b isoform X1 [Silurus meridionalis]